MMRSILTSLVAIALLVSCSGESGVDPRAEQDPLPRQVTNPFELSFGEAVTVQNEGVSVAFTEVLEESRCPSDVVCVWEGRIIIGLEVVDLPSDTFFVPVTLRPGTLGPIPPPKDTLGFRFSLLDVTPYPISTETIADSEYVARLAVFRLDEVDSVDGEIQILDNPPPVGDQFAIESVEIDDDVMIATVWHSGGCGEHEFGLYFSPPNFMESFPVQATLTVRHTDLGDPCDAYLKRDISFDLRPLAQYYEMMYGQRDCMILQISDELAGRADTNRATVWYYPTGMSPSDPCKRSTE